MFLEKNYTCCFSGHRPDKLPWGYNEKDIRCIEQKFRLELAIIKALSEGYKNFITGMAIGTDMYCAEIVLGLKKDYPQIVLECAIPFDGQALNYSEQLRSRYKKITDSADILTVLAKEYSKSCFMIRNKYMVDKSSLLIAIFGGGSGGTKNTIEYAKRNDVETVVLNPGGIK